MLRAILRFLFKGKRAIVVVPLLLLFGAMGWEALHFWWDHGFSRGTYEGVVRKVSFKGPPYCKYVSIELIVGGAAMMQPKVLEFTLDDSHEGTPLYKKFQDAERSQKNVSVSYRQDLKQWWQLEQCTPTEYRAVDVQ